MPVIAMNQEMGSKGKDVAALLAQQLGLTLVRHEVVDHVAEKMRAKKSLIRRIMEGKAGIIEGMATDKKSLAIYTAEEVFELALKGNVVIRGWGATYLLRAVPHIPCIRVCAPLEVRMKWLMAQLETDDEELVREELRRSDAAHIANMQQRFGVTWGDPLIYDMVLNTERLSVETCVEEIKLLLQRPEFQETPQSRAKLQNLALEARVRSALKSDPDTDDINITIEADNGHVKLLGIVLHDSERVAAEKTARAVAGVAAVDNQLKVMSRSRLFTSEKYD
ncbi:cytidylate kinase family protein [Pelomicrobium methylotrophicum]|uniref:BON domain-containing protein n=1 Tax=Pelomicrobium methylotrophicum TaxID=2602750 RepID=A0A5C7EHE5_9PROT|nr:cytidylate kinase family protein [Pelomicrobium methylotrophicum]TXF09943.1 BON domain-containing protein [Pelomicrobium methylotrophicum]